MTTISLTIRFPDDPRGPAYSEQMQEAFRNRVRGVAEEFTKAWDGEVTVEERKPLVIVEVSGGLADESVYPDESAVNLIHIDWDAFDSDNGPEDENEYLRVLEEQRAIIEQIPDEGHRKAILDAMARERVNIDEELHEKALQAYEAGKAQGIDP